MDYYAEMFPDQESEATSSIHPHRRLVVGIAELIALTQRDTCLRWGAKPLAANEEDRVLVATPLHTGRLPIYGLRMKPTTGNSGWHLWQDSRGGEIPDTFSTIFVAELAEHVLPIMRYLALPAGWRFAASTGHEEIWKDRLTMTRYLPPFLPGVERTTDSSSDARHSGTPLFRRSEYSLQPRG